MLKSHTHCQVARAKLTSQNLAKSVSAPTHGQKRKSTIAQHCIRAIAGEVVKSKSVDLINFCGGGQLIALKCQTTPCAQSLAFMLKKQEVPENPLKSREKY